MMYEDKLVISLLWTRWLAPGVGARGDQEDMSGNARGLSGFFAPG